MNLCRAVESVLSQTYSNIEIIVVDDKGIGTEYQIQTEQELAEYIASDTIQYIQHEVNKNGSAARNTGLQIAQGKYVNFLDDDVMISNKISSQVEILEKNSCYDAAYCNSKIVCPLRTFVSVRNSSH